MKWALGLRKAGYATDPAYADKLISIIERYELWKLDGSKKPLNAKKERKNKKTKIVDNKRNDKSLKKYIVKKGDTLYSISKQLKVSVSDLININNLSGNTISIGQVLKLE